MWASGCDPGVVGRAGVPRFTEENAARSYEQLWKARGRSGGNDPGNCWAKTTGAQMTMQKLPRVRSGQSPDRVNPRVGRAQPWGSGPAAGSAGRRVRNLKPSLRTNLWFQVEETSFFLNFSLGCYVSNSLNWVCNAFPVKNSQNLFLPMWPQ